jgi:hypothetical protein
VTGRRLDGIAVPPAVRGGELERAGRLHRAPPHVDGLVEDPRDDRHRVEPEVPADRRVVEARGEQDGRSSQRPGSDDHLRRPDDEPPRHRLERIPGRARERLSGRRIDPQHPGLDADGAPALDEHPRHAGALDDPGPRRVGRREVDPEPGLLGPPRTAERTAATVATVHRVASRRTGLPAEQRPPRRITWSFGGMTVDGLTPSSRSITATPSSNSAPSTPVTPWSRAHSARTS